MRHALAALFLLAAPVLGGDKPNIIYILADDLGYGDVHALNPDCKIKTPNIDRLAAAGMAFTDAHSGSAVCSPTRYGILTGRYCFRSPLKSAVLQGYSPRLIEPGRLTVPSLLKQHGYHTACFGKWHLGMDFPLKDGAIAKGYDDQWKVDYATPIANGPTTVGFDEYFGISASLDMAPYAFIHNDRVTAVPTADKTWSRKGGVTGGVGSSHTPLTANDKNALRVGPTSPDFDAVEVLPTLTKKAVDYIAAAKAGEPFFLYLPLNAPHTPILPTKEWQGKSGLNEYGDFVMQVDDTVGKVMAALDKAGLADNTLVVMTSDNGCSPSANFPELHAKGHHPSFHFRGYKADIYDGGHHIPFIVRWPGRVKPGTTSDQLTCLTDLMATAAEIVGTKLPDTAGEDSVSILPALEGRATGPLREAVVHHSMNGSFAIRQGKWKLELCPGSGGWSYPRPNKDDQSKLPPVQLYDMTADVAEKANVQDKHPDVVAKLTRLMEKYAADGRSTPGTPQPNTGEVDVWKAGKAAQKPLRRASATPQAAKPNVIILFADDLGYGDLGCFGSPVIKTPNFDRFAATATKLTNCYAGAPNCSPSRACLLTGRFASRVGMFDIMRATTKEMHLREWEVTIPELLKPAGYDTYHVGKWHLSLGDDEEAGNPHETKAPLKYGFDVTKDSGIKAPAAAADLIHWIGNRSDPSKPFFAYVAFHESHEPVLKRVIPDYRKPYESPEAERLAKTIPYGWVPRPPKAKWENRTAYFGVVAQLDAAVGRIMDYLDNSGLGENTFVFFTSDNGPEHRAQCSFGSPGPLRGAKGHLHEGGIRVPGIVRWPGHTKAGVTVDEPVGVVDLLPTVCAVTGVAAPSDRTIDGVNMLPAIVDAQKLDRKTPMFWSFWAGRGGYQYSMRDGDWKILAATGAAPADKPLIDHVKGGKFTKFALHNLRDDPTESHDLATEKPAEYERMKGRFLDLYAEVMRESPTWKMDEFRDKGRQLGK